MGKYSRASYGRLMPIIFSPRYPIRYSSQIRSRVVRSEDGTESLQIDGHLLMQPRTAWGRVLAYRVLRRPERLGSIHYTARPSDLVERATEPVGAGAVAPADSTPSRDPGESPT